MAWNIGFIGFGNMAGAMAKGLVQSGAVQGQQIYACAQHWEKLQAACEPLGVNPCATAEEVLAHSDLVVLAVKPHQLAAVVAPIREQLKEKVLLSVVYGNSFEALEALVPGSRHISCIPNTPVAVCQGIYILEEKHSLSPEELAQLKALLEPSALVLQLDDNQFAAGCALAGCGPAFAAQFMEALADGALKFGLRRPQAYALAAQMLQGSAALLLQSGQHPGQMKDAVCSPGGQTIRGVVALEKSGFRGSLISAMEALLEK